MLSSTTLNTYSLHRDNKQKAPTTFALHSLPLSLSPTLFIHRSFHPLLTSLLPFSIATLPHLTSDLFHSFTHSSLIHIYSFPRTSLFPSFLPFLSLSPSYLPVCFACLTNASSCLPCMAQTSPKGLLYCGCSPLHSTPRRVRLLT